MRPDPEQEGSRRICVTDLNLSSCGSRFVKSAFRTVVTTIREDLYWRYFLKLLLLRVLSSA